MILYEAERLISSGSAIVNGRANVVRGSLTAS